MSDKGRSPLFIIAAALAVNMFVGGLVYSQALEYSDENEALSKLNTMMRVMMLIRQDYVDEEKTEYESLIYNALQGMVSQLDPHSSFLEPENYQHLREMTEGEFGGIGIIVTMREGELTVVSPIEGTPGDRAGLQAGDIIKEIDGELISELGLQEAVKMMKGEPGTEVTLIIERPEKEEAEEGSETIEIVIKRSLIEVESVKDTRMLEDLIGYTKIVQFNENTSSNLLEALKELEEEGMESLILDLRNNPGGMLQASVEVCSYFLPVDSLIVTTEGRRPSQYNKFKTKRVPFNFDGPLVILINQGSASASEIVAGALNDNDRAVLVGETSFGKGSVQSIIRLPDESALRLTTAYYYTPSRRVIHEKGITPDVEVKLSREEKQNLLEARRRAAEQQEFIDPADDPQLQRAAEILRSYDAFQKAGNRD